MVHAGAVYQLAFGTAGYGWYQVGVAPQPTPHGVL
jgi:hypothetical protein